MIGDRVENPVDKDLPWTSFKPRVIYLEPVRPLLLLVGLNWYHFPGVVVGDDKYLRLLRHSFSAHLADVAIHDSLITLLPHSLGRLHVELHRVVEYVATLQVKVIPALSLLAEHVLPLPGARICARVRGACADRGVSAARKVRAHDMTTRECARKNRHCAHWRCREAIIPMCHNRI